MATTDAERRGPQDRQQPGPADLFAEVGRHHDVAQLRGVDAGPLLQVLLLLLGRDERVGRRSDEPQPVLLVEDRYPGTRDVEHRGDVLGQLREHVRDRVPPRQRAREVGQHLQEQFGIRHWSLADRSEKEPLA